ncbi:23S rRNA (uracil(1939)-C(5))-methyltransferase RlmD [Candidatus Peregrinibacteria bacterium]|nr:23S rRNA (uracil(1939)-C(5))-methyltransferase RlmD [Candidatus Peregrinibacteria bacterium]
MLNQLHIIIKAKLMKLKKGDKLQVTIQNLAFGGAGVAHHQTDQGNFVIFVDGVAPGEKVEIVINHIKKRLAKGYVTKYIEYSKLRIKPKCPHFGSDINDQGEIIDAFDKSRNCGGCSWQFLSYSDQIKIKEKIVKESLNRIGGISENDLELIMRPIVGMETPWFYRNKMEFSFEYDKSGILNLGLHLKGRHHDVSKIEQCFLFNDWIGDFLVKCRDFFPNIKFDGTWKTLTVREGQNTGEILINLAVENGNIDFEEELIDFILKSMKGKNLKSLYLTQIHNKKGTRKKIEEKILWGKAEFQEKLFLEDGRSFIFNVTSQAFLQPNTKQSGKLYSLINQIADLKGDEKIFDLYCGTGTIGLTLAESAAKVIGIELNESAIESAKKNAILNSVDNISFICGNVTEVLNENVGEADLVVVDPPRAGLNEKVIKTIIESNSPKLIYVSCNPTTLARDIKLLTEGGFKLEIVRPIDQFCQTYHIETVSLLKKID